MSRELDVSLHPAQLEIFNSTARFKVVSAGRRFGKSRLAAWILIIKALQSESKDVFYIGPTFQQAKDIMWNMLKELLQDTDLIEQTHENTATMTLVNGRKISLKGSDRPDTLRGVGLAYVVLDEYASMKVEVWEQIIRPTLADVKGGALFIGTPAGKNHFYEIWKEAELIISSKKSTDKYSKPIVDLSIATILSINSSGVGERVCIDLIERLKIGEGMVIGSNSSSLALVHGETIESEYVPSRPFRVNAGSIHSYVLMSDGSTKYLSELSAGDEVSVISHSGIFRKSIIGRLKIERRPFLIIRFRSMSGNEGQIMLQQAETVRLVNASGSIISVTNLEIGDEIIVRNDNQMRHIGNALDGEMREK